MDELQNFQTSSLGSSSQSLTLGILEVGGDGDNGGVDFPTKVVGRRVLQAAEVAGRNL